MALFRVRNLMIYIGLMLSCSAFLCFFPFQDLELDDQQFSVRIHQRGYLVSHVPDLVRPS